MGSWRAGVTAVAAWFALAVVGLAPAVGAAGHGCSWSIDAIGRIGSWFEDVDALSATDAWAVGTEPKDHTFPHEHPLIEHWNGSSWTRVASPPSTYGKGDLFAVDALAADDVWAVGEQEMRGRPGVLQLYEHWNGSRWRVVDPPPQEEGSVAGVAAVAHDDVWAVGDRRIDGRLMTRIWHWDGSAWSRVAAPTFEGFLTGVSASHGHVLVVGHEFDTVSSILLKGPRVWRRVPIDGDAAQGELTDVSGGWAIGNKGGPPVAEAVHRTSDGWVSSPVDTPEEGSSIVAHSITPVAEDDVWGFGWRTDLDAEPYVDVFEIVHWDGVAWTRVAGPGGSLDDQDRIYGSTLVPGTETVLAVGNVSEGPSISRAAVLRHC
jgi:hypothetical protein